MTVCAVLGGQWGDEAKGKIVDYLSEKISLNIKPNKVLVAPSWNYDCENFINWQFFY